MARRIRPAPSSPAQRSLVSNSPHRLPGVDMRSAAGRRFRDLVDIVIAEFGGANTEAVRELGTLRYLLETTQAAVIAGDARRSRDITPLLRSIDKKETALRQAKAAERAKAAPTLADYLRGGK